MALKAPERSSSRKSAPSHLSYLKSPSLWIFLPFFLFFLQDGAKRTSCTKADQSCYTVWQWRRRCKGDRGCRCQQERACTGPAGLQRLDAILLPAIMLPFHGIWKRKRKPCSHLVQTQGNPASHKRVKRLQQTATVCFLQFPRLLKPGGRERKTEKKQEMTLAAAANNMTVASEVIPRVCYFAFLVFCLFNFWRSPPLSHLCRCDGVDVLRGEALQQGGLPGVVQPQQHYPDLLLCGSLQLLNDRE